MDMGAPGDRRPNFLLQQGLAEGRHLLAQMGRDVQPTVPPPRPVVPLDLALQVTPKQLQPYGPLHALPQLGLSVPLCLGPNIDAASELGSRSSAADLHDEMMQLGRQYVESEQVHVSSKTLAAVSSLLHM